MDVAAWLQELGLERYEAAFREADIAPAILPELTDRDLAELGVAPSHRRLLLKAIRALSPDPVDHRQETQRSPRPPGERSAPLAHGCPTRILLTGRAAAADGAVL